MDYNNPLSKDDIIDKAKYANRGEKSMGIPDVFNLLLRLRKGATIGSIKRPKKTQIGCIGSNTQESREFIIMAHESIFINQITLTTSCLNKRLPPNKLLPPTLRRSFYLPG